MSLLLRITPQALGSTISPTVLAVTMLLLGARDRPKLRSLVFLAGSILLLVLVAAFELFVLVGAQTQTDAHNGRAQAAVDIALAILLLAVAARNILRRGAETEEKTRSSKSKPPSLLSALLLGLGIMATNFSTLVLYISGIKEVRAARPDSAIEAAAVIYLIFFAVLPIAGPLVGTVLAPKVAARVLTPLNSFAKAHSSQIGTAICVLFAVYLAAKGFEAL